VIAVPEHADPLQDTFLAGLRVLEIADELGEYCGKLLAGLGADVVKVEPVAGETTRAYGPFYQDQPHHDRSLHFWHFNLGKRSVVHDLDTVEGQGAVRALAAQCDIVIDTRPRGYFTERGLGYEDLRRINPGVIYLRITPFGDTGPWADFEASDLIHLALGGVMMNCGYDPDPSGAYETPPIAPQMWHAYQITGEIAAISVLGALLYRLDTGEGQLLEANVHEAVSTNTETDLPDWVFLRQKHLRQTSRHSMVSASVPALSLTKDGRYVMPYRTYLGAFGMNWDGMRGLLRKYGMQSDLDEPQYDDKDYRLQPGVIDRVTQLTDKLVARLMYDRDIWRDAQDFGLPWAPVRRPEENVTDEHWSHREAFLEIEHPELGETFTYAGAKWFCEDVRWANRRRAPLLGEHTAEVAESWRTPAPSPLVVRRQKHHPVPQLDSVHDKPFALRDIRVIDLSWMLASAGSGRFLAALGAEVIKVEHESRWDAMRFSLGQCPPGGRAERDAATAPLATPPAAGPNRGGSFMEINAGKLGISLNLKSAEGLEVLKDLIRDADVVLEGFSPGTMDRMGLGYDELRRINPSIVYVQQSGFGQRGTYDSTKAFGPTAQAFTGVTEMSGLPEPFPPAGWGYSYLDWFGAYNMANAVLAALYRRNRTGKSVYIDSSQGETGLYLTGTAVLDHSANGRRWQRYGNRSPYKPAAPHGAYRTRGDDRWIAIGCFTQPQWESLLDVLGRPDALVIDEFATLEGRLAHQDALDAALNTLTERADGTALMQALQGSGVPAGVCQTAEDRYEHDPQLAHLGWMVELDQTEIGRWPVKSHPVRMSATPSYIGGRYDHSGPNYGEHTERVLAEVLDLSPERIEELRKAGAL